MTKPSSRLPRSMRSAGAAWSVAWARRDVIPEKSIANARAASAMAAEKMNAEDGRIPVRLERHDPIDGREGDRQNIDGETRTAESAPARGAKRVGSPLGCRRRPAQQQRRAHPEDEIERRANHKEGGFK